MSAWSQKIITTAEQETIPQPTALDLHTNATTRSCTVIGRIPRPAESRVALGAHEIPVAHLGCEQPERSRDSSARGVEDAPAL